jgi:hypothetical protein
MIVPVTTTSKSKQVIIEDLAIAFEQRDITLQDERWLVDELENFTYIYNVNTRAVQYSAPIGLHDDGVISLALAWHCRKTQQNKGRYQVIRA